MRVEGARGPDRRVAPHVPEKVVLEMDAGGVGGEPLQERELLGRELDALPGEVDVAAHRIDGRVAAPKDPAAGAPAGSSQQRAYAAEQLRVGERLGLRLFIP